MREKRKLHQTLSNMPWNCTSKFSQEVLKPHPPHLSTLGKKYLKGSKGGDYRNAENIPLSKVKSHVSTLNSHLECFSHIFETLNVNIGDRPGPQNLRLHSFKVISSRFYVKGWRVLSYAKCFQSSFGHVLNLKRVLSTLKVWNNVQYKVNAKTIHYFLWTQSTLQLIITGLQCTLRMFLIVKY